MNKFLLTVFLSFIGFSFSNGQGTFRHTYGLGSLNAGYQIVQAADHGFLICGSVATYQSSQTDVYLIKTDSVGNFIFHTNVGGLSIDRGNALLELADKSILIAGYTNSASATNDYDGYLVLLDSVGTIIWAKTTGTSDWDFYQDVKATPDGNFIAIGKSYGSGSGNLVGWMTKFDRNGTILWDKFLQMPGQLELLQLVVRSDGNYFVCGQRTPVLNGMTDAFLSYIDTSGDPIWTRTVDTVGWESFTSVNLLSNGDVVVGMTVKDRDSLNIDQGLARYDENNVEIFFVLFTGKSGRDEITNILIQNDTIIFTGFTSTTGAGNIDFQMAKFTSVGSYIDGNTYGYIGNEYCYHSALVNDGGYALIGTTNTYGPGLMSVLLVKTDHVLFSSATTVIKVDEINANPSYSVWPNPSHGNFTVQVDGGASLATIRLFNYAGSLIYETKPAAIKSQVQLNDLSSGLYILELTSENGVVMRKKIVIN